ncbi:hypothetical protein ACMGEG_08090 [Staphylococcus aureus]
MYFKNSSLNYIPTTFGGEPSLNYIPTTFGGEPKKEAKQQYVA